MTAKAVTAKHTDFSGDDKSAIAPSVTQPQFTQLSPVGVSIGNNGIKIHSQGIDAFLSSLIQMNFDAPLGDCDSTDGVQVEVVSSTNAELKGQRFWCGRAAWDNSPTATKRLHDVNDGKRQYSPHMVLAAIALLPPRKHHELKLFLSAPYKELADVLRSELNHTFTLRLNGNLCTANISVAGVRPEAHAAAFYVARQATAQNKPGDVLVLDFGEGNTTLCLTDARGKMKHRKPLNTGVSALLDAIAFDERMIPLNGGFAPSRELVRLGIENNSLRIGGQRGQDFSAIYVEQLNVWASRQMDEITSKSRDFWAQSTHIVAIGGGAMLPGLKEILSPYGVTIAPKAQHLDARGLALMAELTGGV